MSTAALEERPGSVEETPSPPPGDLSHLGDERKIGRLVLRMAWPAILENALHTLLGIVDTILVARLGNEAVAGVGAGTQWLFLFVSVVFGLSTGSIVLIARSIGASDPAAANRAVRQSILFGVAGGLFFTVVGFVGADAAMAVLGARDEVARIGASYLRILALGGVLTSVALVFGSVLRAAGDTRTPMLATAVANVVNAVVAYVLIFGHLGLPALGADGSAWGLNTARLVAFAILVLVLARGRGVLKLDLSGWMPDPAILGRIIRFGAPTALEQMIMMTSFMAFAWIAIQLGTVAFATQRITFNAITIAFLPAFGFAIAATTLTGQALGARRPDLAERTAWVAVRLAGLWMGAMALVYFFAGEPLLRVFTADPEVLAVGVPAMRVIALATPIWSLGMVLSGALRGAGDTRFPLLVTTVTGWAIRVPVGYAFGLLLGFGLMGVYAGTLADASLSAALMVWRYRRGKWREIKV
ncbi:MAG TPA: MATE family efflux transporter [Chloroflexota bacterium]